MKFNPLPLLFLLLILCVAFFLNFYRLDQIPSGLYVDEALSSYNAYSVLTTGKDEYGKSFPILFRFFGTYSPPLYTYLTVSVIAIHGLNIFSTRFISALSGVLVVYILFNLLKSSKIIRSKFTPYLVALLLTISPWHLLYARAGYEIYLGFCLFTLGAYFCWKALDRPKFLVPGLAVLSLSTYGAHTERYLVPIFILCLLIFFSRKFWPVKSRKFTLIGLLFAGLIQIPHLTILFTPAMWQKQALFFSQGIQDQAIQYFSWLPYPIAWTLALARKFLAQYLTYFSPRSLFFLPDPDPQRSLPDLSVFYPWMLIPYLIGLYLLVKNRKNPSIKYLLILTLLTPLPAALTNDPFSTQRALPLLLPLMVIISIGIDNITAKLKPILYSSLFVLLLLNSLVLLWRSYFILLPGERARVWGYGFSQLAGFIKTHSQEHFLIDQARTKPAYIELAFFLQVPPEQLQQSSDPQISADYYHQIKFTPERQFANIETRSITWEQDPYFQQILVGDELAISPDQAQEYSFTQVLEIRDPLNQIIFRGYRTDPQQRCLDINFASQYCH